MVSFYFTIRSRLGQGLGLGFRVAGLVSSLPRLGVSVYLQYLHCEERLGQRGSTGYKVQGGTYDWESIMGA